MQQWYPRPILWICDVKVWDTCEQQLKYMVNKKLVTGLKPFKGNQTVLLQKECVEGKMCQNPFKLMGIQSTGKLQLVHSDVCGPMPIVSWYTL